MISEASSKMRVMHRMFDDAWKTIDTGNKGVDYAIMYIKGLLSLHEVIVMIVTNNFLLPDTKCHKFPYNLLDLVRDMVEEGTIYAWGLTIIQ